jgi:hypothetical protein
VTLRKKPDTELTNDFFSGKWELFFVGRRAHNFPEKELIYSVQLFHETFADLFIVVNSNFENDMIRSRFFPFRRYLLFFGMRQTRCLISHGLTSYPTIFWLSS